MRIALVHDWLTGMRGGERVLDVLARMHPDASIHTLFHRPGSTGIHIESHPIRTSPLDRIPGARRHHRAFLPLFPWAVRQLEVGDVDLVISTSHAVAKSVRVPEAAAHLCYCFTPMRYIWDQVDAYLGRGPMRLAAAPLIRSLRAFDVAHSGPESVDRFVAISAAVSDRIRRAYGREAHVLHPPVDTDRFQPDGRSPDDFFLMVAGFVPYKREDYVIDAFRASGRRLIVVGDGPLRIRLERSAAPNIEFTGRVDDATLAGLYARCRALVYPQDEDFGLVAVEVQAAGRPVIAFARGGALETICPLPQETDRGGRVGDPAPTPPAPPTGLFFMEQTPAALEAGLRRFEANEHLFEPATLRRHAEHFSEARFVRAFSEIEDQTARKRHHAIAPDIPGRAR